VPQRLSRGFLLPAIAIVTHEQLRLSDNRSTRSGRSPAIAAPRWHHVVAGEREHPPAAEPRERLRKDFGAPKRLGHPVPFRELRDITNFARG